MKGNILKRILKWMVIVFLILCILAASIIYYALYIYPRNITRIKTDSQLRSAITPEGYDYNDAMIKTAILEHLPIGAAHVQVKAFLTQHFTDFSYTDRSTTFLGLHNKPKETHIYIHAIDIATLAGGETVEIFLILDSNEHLKDVVVKSHRAYL